MAFENYKQKEGISIVFTGDGKGKTSAALGTLVRALGAGKKCAFVQFIKYWDVSEHKFLETITEVYPNHLTVYKGGGGFFEAGEMSAKGVSDEQHKDLAQHTYSFALSCSESDEYDLVVCDEILYAHQKGLVTKKQLQLLIDNKTKASSLCLTGQGFPESLIDSVDIVTDMKKIKHHFDEQYLANKGIDY